MINKQTAEVEALRLIHVGGTRLAPRLAAVLGVSSQVANLYVRRLVEKGWVTAEGKTKARQYRLAPLSKGDENFSMTGLSEDKVWASFFAPVVKDLPENVRGIWNYGITEMVNNAIDHSGAKNLGVGFERNALYTDGWIMDDGVGIFEKIQNALNLEDPRESILELAKGKLTTDPQRHSGEGIFFTSKSFDEFNILSGRLHFSHDKDPLDILVERDKESKGTLVLMRIENQSPRTTKEVFDRFAAPEEYSFDRTLVPVRLAQYEGENLVSRSQAKRLYRRFDRFKHVALDFEGVSLIGQAFADELFRVFADGHREIELTTLNMNRDVENMVRRAKSKALPEDLMRN